MASKPVAKNSRNTTNRPAAQGPRGVASKPVAKGATKSIDLSKLFGSVAKTMAQNKADLNAADTYNHDHGDHMVEIFEVITQAMKEKQNASPADQLAYASQILRQKSQSGSAQVYAESLSDASSQFKGAKQIDGSNIMDLIQSVLGAQGSVEVPTQQAQGGGDLLGGLLGGLMGGGQSAQAQSGGVGDLLGGLLGGGQSAQTQSGGAGDLIGDLLGGLTGAQQPQTAQAPAASGKIDIGTLLNAGMAFAQSKQSGGSNLDAILNAVVSSSKLSDSSHRSQSGTLVANTLLQMAGKMLGGK